MHVLRKNSDLTVEIADKTLWTMQLSHHGFKGILSISSRLGIMVPCIMWIYEFYHHLCDNHLKSVDLHTLYPRNFLNFKVKLHYYCIFEKLCPCGKKSLWITAGNHPRRKMEFPCYSCSTWKIPDKYFVLYGGVDEYIPPTSIHG